MPSGSFPFAVTPSQRFSRRQKNPTANWLSTDNVMAKRKRCCLECWKEQDLTNTVASIIKLVVKQTQASKHAP
jgi:hypothetical protein